MSNEFRQSEGRVAELQKVLAENSGRLGITVSAKQIGLKANGSYDDVMGPQMVRAMEQLVMIAQLDAGTDPKKVTRHFSQSNIDRVNEYMEKNGVKPEQISAFIAGIFNLKDDKKPGNRLSTFEQAYDGVARQTNAAELAELAKALKARTQPAKEAPKPPSNGEQINVGRDFAAAKIKPKKPDFGTETMTYADYQKLSTSGKVSSKDYERLIRYQQRYKETLTQNGYDDAAAKLAAINLQLTTTKADSPESRRLESDRNKLVEDMQRIVSNTKEENIALSPVPKLKQPTLPDGANGPIATNFRP